MDRMATVRGRHFSLTAGEISGAVGDAVTVLPIVVGVAALTDLGLGRMLLGFAVFQVVWGLGYGVPISVEPMKALAALVIAGALTTAELATAGLLAGAILLGVGTTGSLARLQQYVATPVVRGVQLGVALLLARTGLELGVGDPTLALGGALVALLAIAVGYRKLAALATLGFGLVLALGTPDVTASAVPALGIPTAFPSLTLSFAVTQATIAQLAMTVGNAAVATSLLLSDFFDADISPDELASSMGVMNLLAVPLGGLPMCHGSGGLAGKYAFGARTASANLLLGGLYAIAALGFVGLVASFPLAVLGVVLVLVAIQLGNVAWETDDLALTVGVGIVGLLVDVGIAFVLGTFVALALGRMTDE